MSGNSVSIASRKPCSRWSVVETPGMTLTTKTLPAPPISSARPRAARRPPSTLSVATSPSWMSAVDCRVHAKHRYASVDCRLDRRDHALPVIRRHHDRARSALHHRVENRRLQGLIEALWTLGVDAHVSQCLSLCSRSAVHRDVEVVRDDSLDKGDGEGVLPGRRPEIPTERTT